MIIRYSVLYGRPYLGFNNFFYSYSIFNLSNITFCSEELLTKPLSKTLPIGHLCRDPRNCLVQIRFFYVTWVGIGNFKWKKVLETSKKVLWDNNKTFMIASMCWHRIVLSNLHWIILSILKKASDWWFTCQHGFSIW